MATCANCNKSIGFGERYCSECLDYLVGAGKLSYADTWKYVTSKGGCIGCRYILGDSRCENCIRTHTPAPPFMDYYEKGVY